MESTISKIEIKKQLLNVCLKTQNRLVDTAKEAMRQAQESANEEPGGSEDKFESFKEQCQIDRDMYAKQFDEAVVGLHILRRIETSKKNDIIQLGSVVVTDSQSFFVSVSLGEIKLEDGNYFAISTMSPLYKVMAEKRQGDTFQFRDKKYKVLDVF